MFHYSLCIWSAATQQILYKIITGLPNLFWKFLPVLIYAKENLLQCLTYADLVMST